MSMFKVDVGVGNLDGGDLAPVQPVVDTGAAHSMLPESLMTQLRIEPREHLRFILADGTRVRYGYGFARFSIDGDERPCPVIFGPDGNYLLGRRRWRRSTWWWTRWASGLRRRSGCRWVGADLGRGGAGAWDAVYGLENQLAYRTQPSEDSPGVRSRSVKRCCSADSPYSHRSGDIDGSWPASSTGRAKLTLLICRSRFDPESGHHGRVQSLGKQTSPIPWSECDGELGSALNWKTSIT